MAVCVCVEDWLTSCEYANSNTPPGDLHIEPGAPETSLANRSTLTLLLLSSSSRKMTATFRVGGTPGREPQLRVVVTSEPACNAGLLFSFFHHNPPPKLPCRYPSLNNRSHSLTSP